MTVERLCFACNLPLWKHERDKFGNIVRRAQFRTNDSPPICVPGRRLGRMVDAQFTKGGTFARRVA